MQQIFEQSSGTKFSFFELPSLAEYRDNGTEVPERFPENKLSIVGLPFWQYEPS